MVFLRATVATLAHRPPKLRRRSGMHGTGIPAGLRLRGRLV